MPPQRPANARITQTTGFWELRAEQVMDRVFGGNQVTDESDREAAWPDRPRPFTGTTPRSPAGGGSIGRADPGADPSSQPPESEPIDVVVEEPRPEAAEARTGSIADARPTARARDSADATGEVPVPTAVPPGTVSQTQLLLWGSLFSLPLLVLVGVLLRNLNHSETALNQERNLLLLERLRALGAPGQGADASAAGSTAQPPGAADAVPPPPPEDDWITELGQLPQSSAPQAEVLRVPASGRIAAPAPPVGNASGSSSSERPSGPVPVLVGVIQSQGRGGSAIFQVGGASASATTGELIGGSGWRLRATGGDSAVIERGGEQRRLSISTGL